jgi:20S proteasome subunit alpha 4
LFIHLYHRLQDARTIRKIVKVDDHTVLAFAGLTADARVLINKLRVEAQSYRLTMEDAPSVDYLARFLATTQQNYTQRGGVRPFGIATLLTGILPEEQPETSSSSSSVGAQSGRPYLYQTDPAGTHSRWKAQVIGGRNAKSLREFLEKNYQPDMEEAATIKLAIQALLEVVDSGAKTMEICVVRRGGISNMMEEADIETVVKDIEAEQEDKRSGGTTSTGGSAATTTSQE